MKMRYFALIGALALGACDSTSQDPASLKGNAYSVNKNDTEITLEFDATNPMIYGKVINRYNGVYNVSSTNKIEFGPIMSTMMAGPENMMQAESEYYKFLETVTTYKIKKSSLVLSNDNGQSYEFKLMSKAVADAEMDENTETDETVEEAEVVESEVPADSE